MKRILIIKLGALGDFIQATAAFADIRDHHSNDHITLLTTASMLPLAEKAPFFDAVSLDERKSIWNIPYIMRLQRKLKGFDYVYDLQTSDRTSLYYWLAGKPKWCGIAKGCSRPHNNPERNNMHSLDRIAEQIKNVGVISTHKPNIDYLSENADELLSKHNLIPKNTVVLVAGGAAHRPEKRWKHFAELAEMLIQKGFQVVLIGSKAESDLLKDITQKTGANNLCQQTSLGQLVDIFSKVKVVIGNDTGPMHIAATCGAKGAVLFGKGSNPQLCAPRSKGLEILQNDDIDAISPQEALDKAGLC